MNTSLYSSADMGKAIRQARKEAGLSQYSLAELVNLSKASIGFYERGERIPSISTIIAIAKATDKPLTYFSKEETPISENVGMKIRKVRQERGLNLYTCADYSGIHYKALNDYEQGRQIPSLEVLNALSDTLGVPLSEFVDNTPEFKKDFMIDYKSLDNKTLLSVAHSCLQELNNRCKE